MTIRGSLLSFVVLIIVFITLSDFVSTDSIVEASNYSLLVTESV